MANGKTGRWAWPEGGARPAGQSPLLSFSRFARRFRGPSEAPSETCPRQRPSLRLRGRRRCGHNVAWALPEHTWPLSSAWDNRPFTAESGRASGLPASCRQESAATGHGVATSRAAGKSLRAAGRRTGPRLGFRPPALLLRRGAACDLRLPAHLLLLRRTEPRPSERSPGTAALSQRGRWEAARQERALRPGSGRSWAGTCRVRGLLGARLPASNPAPSSSGERLPHVCKAARPEQLSLHSRGTPSKSCRRFSTFGGLL